MNHTGPISKDECVCLYTLQVRMCGGKRRGEKKMEKKGKYHLPFQEVGQTYYILSSESAQTVAYPLSASPSS